MRCGVSGAHALSAALTAKISPAGAWVRITSSPSSEALAPLRHAPDLREFERQPHVPHAVVVLHGKMKVRTGGVAGVAGERYDLPGLDHLSLRDHRGAALEVNVNGARPVIVEDADEVREGPE